LLNRSQYNNSSIKFKVNILAGFLKSAKKLSKKYPSFKKELQDLIDSLPDDPRQGSLIIEDTYKIRLAIKSKGKGKSSRARVITNVRVKMKTKDDLTIITLVEIYDKSDMPSINKNILKEIISEFILEEE